MDYVSYEDADGYSVEAELHEGNELRLTIYDDDEYGAAHHTLDLFELLEPTKYAVELRQLIRALFKQNLDLTRLKYNLEDKLSRDKSKADYDHLQKKYNQLIYTLKYLVEQEAEIKNGETIN